MLVSFVIPVYNGSHFIKQCIHTLLNQTYTHWEAIFINDGSNDNTQELLSRESGSDHRIKVYHQTNQGAAAARNKGIELASGNYITFLDVDDTLSEVFLDTLIKQISNEIDIIVCPFNIIKGNKIIKRKKYTPNIFSKLEFLKNVLTGHAGWELWGKLYRKELFTTPLITPQNIRIGEDASIFIQLVTRSNKIKVLDKALYNYIQYESSVSHIQSTKYAEETLQAGYFIEKILKNEPFYSMIQKEIGGMFLLFYSNSTRKGYLGLNHPLVHNIYKTYFSYQTLQTIPFIKRIYVTVSLLLGQFLSKVVHFRST